MDTKKLALQLAEEKYGKLNYKGNTVKPRPINPQNGDCYYNERLPLLEIYVEGRWVGLKITIATFIL